MRKDVQDIFDTSSSLLLTGNKIQYKDHQQAEKSQLEISIDALLGELSEIKAENGIGMLVQPEGGLAAL